MANQANKTWTGAFGNVVGTPPRSADDLLSAKLKDKQVRKIEQDEELEDLKHKAEKAELEKKLKESESKANAAGSGLQVDGKISLGNFDIMAERAKAEAKVGEVEQMFAEREKELEERALTAEKTLTEYKYETLVKRMDEMNKELMAKLDKFSKGEDNSSDIAALFNKIETLEPVLAKFGYAKGVANPGDSGLQIQLQLKKMDLDNARAEREFKWKMVQEERDAKRQERKDDREMNLKERELADKRAAAEANRDLVSDSVETLGRSIGRGIKDASVEEEPEPIQARPAQRPPSQQKPAAGGNPPPAKSQAYHIEAGEGDHGEFDCPFCAQPVTMGADTVEAECASCGGKIPIQRTAGARQTSE